MLYGFNNSCTLSKVQKGREVQLILYPQPALISSGLHVHLILTEKWQHRVEKFNGSTDLNIFSFLPPTPPPPPHVGTFWARKFYFIRGPAFYAGLVESNGYWTRKKLMEKKSRFFLDISPPHPSSLRYLKWKWSRALLNSGALLCPVLTPRL